MAKQRLVYVWVVALREADPELIAFKSMVQRLGAHVAVVTADRDAPMPKDGVNIVFVLDLHAKERARLQAFCAQRGLHEQFRAWDGVAPERRIVLVRSVEVGQREPRGWTERYSVCRFTHRGIARAVSRAPRTCFVASMVNDIAFSRS